MTWCDRVRMPSLPQMNDDRLPDYYEALQISVNAEPTRCIACSACWRSAHPTIRKPATRCSSGPSRSLRRPERSRAARGTTCTTRRFGTSACGWSMPETPGAGQLPGGTARAADGARGALRAAEARTEQPGHLRPGSREHHRRAGVEVAADLVPRREEADHARRSVSARHHGRGRGLPGEELRGERAAEAAGSRPGRECRLSHCMPR